MSEEISNDQLLDQLQRLAAEYENYRRRTRIDLEQAAKAADAQLLGELLSVLDDFDRAEEHREHHESLVKGMRMTRSRLSQTLERHGLVRIETDGPFDPELHEAVAVEACDDLESGLIVRELRSGYRIDERVIRYAQVVVSA